MYKKIKITERQLKNIVLNHLITEEDSNENNIPNKRILKVGRVGEDVRKLQQRLKDLGYGNLLGTSGPNRDGVDSKYGTNTKKAVYKYQEDTPPLEKDGVAGELTIGKLNGVSNTKKTPIKPHDEKSTNIKITSSPFKSKYEGIKFRKWLNKKLPNISKKYDISKPIDLSDKFINTENFYSNRNIINVLNAQLTYESGTKISVFDYYKIKNPEWNIKGFKEKIEGGIIPVLGLEFKVPTTIKNADRINNELAYINLRHEYIGRGFFIVDPRLNLVLAFDINHKLIDYSESIASSDKQKNVVFTYKKWCELCKNEWVNEFCYKPGTTMEDVLKLKNGDITFEEVKPVMRFDVLEKVKSQYASAGIYKIKYRKHNEYTDEEVYGKTIDTYGLETEDGVSVPAAIHALYQVPRRITADDKLQKFLQKEKKNGTIPQEYIDMVEEDFLSNSGEFDLSSGCFNVDPKFATNPKVQNMAQKGVYVFIMSEKDADYLVQVKQGEEAKFLLDLGGKDGKCKSPSSLESIYGVEISYDDIT